MTQNTDLQEFCESNSNQNGDCVVMNIDELMNEVECYSFPSDSFFRWCKCAIKIQTETTRKLLGKLFAAFQIEVGILFIYSTVDYQKDQSTTSILSILDSPLFKHVYDRFPMPDIAFMLENLQNDTRSKEERIHSQLMKIKELQEVIAIIKSKSEDTEIINFYLNHDNISLKLGITALLENITQFIEEIKALNSSIISQDDELNQRVQEIIALKQSISQRSQSTISTSIPLNTIQTIEPPCIHDIFQGIFEFVRTEYGDDLSDNVVIEVTASSFLNEHTVPSNALKDDGSCWVSEDVKNSWIQFDFKTRSVSLKSYSLRSLFGPKSWKIEGSNDLNTFTLIDLRINPHDFRQCILETQHYNVHSTEGQMRMRFRFIRITQGDDGSTNDDLVFWLHRVHFYGSLHE